MSRIGKHHITNAPELTILLPKALKIQIVFWLGYIEHWLENKIMITQYPNELYFYINSQTKL